MICEIVFKALLKSNETTSTAAKKSHFSAKWASAILLQQSGSRPLASSDIPDSGSGQQIGAAFPHRRQSVTTVTHCFLFATQVLPSDKAWSATTPPSDSLEHFLWKMNFYWSGRKLCSYELHALPWKNRFSFSFKECDKKVWGQVKLIYFWTKWYKRKYRVIS